MWRCSRDAALRALRCTAVWGQTVRSITQRAYVKKTEGGRYTVVLKRDVEDVGKAGDVVKVRHGYARNILIPAKFAVPGTRKNIELYGRQSQEEPEEVVAEDAVAVLQREVEAVLKRLAAGAVEMKRAVVTREKDGKAQPTSALAEAVTAAQVAEAVQKQKRVDLAEQLLFMDPIAEIGEFDVPLRMLYPDGRAPTFRLKVVPTA